LLAPQHVLWERGQGSPYDRRRLARKA